MFDGLDRRPDASRGGRLAASGIVSAALYGGLVAAVMLAPAAGHLARREDSVEVTFLAPPPPPPAPAADVVGETLKVKKVVRPRRSPLVAPTHMAIEKPAEADVVLDVVEVEEAPAQEAPPPPPPPPPPPSTARKPSPSVPIALPDDAEPPEPDPDNRQPEYPEDARVAGREGVVILKVVVSERGEVSRVDVLKGEDPFVSAAVQAVRTWRYEPARIDGEARSVFRIIRVPFRLRA
jgi:TonB family protein